MRRKWSVVAGAAGLLMIAGCAPKETETAAAPPPAAPSAEQAPAVAPTEAAPADNVVLTNSTCPVMGGKVDPAVFVEHEGRKVYFCCAGCPEKFQADPAKYLAALEASTAGEPATTDGHEGHGHAEPAGEGS